MLQTFAEITSWLTSMGDITWGNNNNNNNNNNNMKGCLREFEDVSHDCDGCQTPCPAERSFSCWEKKKMYTVSRLEEMG